MVVVMVVVVVVVDVDVVDACRCMAVDGTARWMEV